MTIIYNMAQMTVSGSPGTGAITLLAPAVADGIIYLSFDAAGALNGDTLPYRIKDGSNWEVGRGVYTTSGTSLARGLIKSNSGSLINVTSAATVSIVPLAENFRDFYATVVAAGTTQATAAVLPNADFIEVTSGTGGVALPAVVSGLERKIRNSTGATIAVYPANGSGATINNRSANASINIIDDSTGHFEAAGTTKWFTIP